MSLITASNNWALWSTLLIIAACGLWLERTRLGSRISAPVMTLLAGFALASLNVIPVSAPTYDAFWHYLAPMAIPLLIFKADLTRSPKALLFALIALALGIATLLAATIAVEFLIPAKDKGWQLAGAFAGGFIGEISHHEAAAHAAALGPNSLRAAAHESHRAIMTLYLVILFLLPSIYKLRGLFNEPPWESKHWHKTAAIVHETAERGARIYVPSLAAALALSAALCAIGAILERKLGFSGIMLLFVTLASAALALGLPKPMVHLNGARELGQLVVYILFAALGAGANLINILNIAPMTLLFAGTLVVIHLVLMLLVGMFARLSLPTMLIASNAVIGNPLTAVAMAGARRWDHFLVPAVVCAAIGNAIALPVAQLVTQLLK